MRNCGALSVTTPPCTGGQIKPPTSSRLVTMQRPEPFHRISLIRSLLLARNTKTSPANGSAIKTSVTMATRPSMPLRKSVGLDATITRSPGRDGMPRITVPIQSGPASDAEPPDRQHLPPGPGPAQLQPQWTPRAYPVPMAAGSARRQQPCTRPRLQCAMAQNAAPSPPPARPSPGGATSKQRPADLKAARHLRHRRSRRHGRGEDFRLLLRRPIPPPLLTGHHLNPTVLSVLMTVLTHSIRTVIIHNFTSPKFKAPVFINSKRAARWGARIGYDRCAGLRQRQEDQRQEATVPRRYAGPADGCDPACGRYPRS
jgi:hypothetical protein